MNKYDEVLLKKSQSMIKGIAVEVDRLNGGRHLTFTLDDVRGMTESTPRTLQRGNERQT